jgi:hypothetical protein
MAVVAMVGKVGHPHEQEARSVVLAWILERIFQQVPASITLSALPIHVSTTASGMPKYIAGAMPIRRRHHHDEAVA